MSYDYFLQTDKSLSLRRYPEGGQTGERWDRGKQEWTPECCDRRSCELTDDAWLNSEEAIEAMSML